jgi:hypothetical protein
VERDDLLGEVTVRDSRRHGVGFGRGLGEIYVWHGGNLRYRIEVIASF